MYATFKEAVTLKWDSVYEAIEIKQIVTSFTLKYMYQIYFNSKTKLVLGEKQNISDWRLHEVNILKIFTV